MPYPVAGPAVRKSISRFRMPVLTVFVPDGSPKEYPGVPSVKLEGGLVVFTSQPDSSSYSAKTVTTNLPFLFEEEING
jgi:hypothetical protein